MLSWSLRQRRPPDPVSTLDHMPDRRPSTEQPAGFVGSWCRKSPALPGLRQGQQTAPLQASWQQGAKRRPQCSSSPASGRKSGLNQNITCYIRASASPARPSAGSTLEACPSLRMVLPGPVLPSTKPQSQSCLHRLTSFNVIYSSRGLTRGERKSVKQYFEFAEGAAAEHALRAQSLSMIICCFYKAVGGTQGTDVKNCTLFPFRSEQL